MRRQSGTRARIQEIALRLFIEQGYEATSLREIAERLGVTKAALYYHFKTKEDIVVSLAEGVVAAIDDLIEWGRTRPNTPAFRAELIRRYCDVVHDKGHLGMMRFLQRNQTVLRGHPAMNDVKKRMLDLMGMLADPAGTPAERLRGAMSLFAIHASWMLLQDDPMSDDERRAAGLEIALELVGRSDDHREDG